jgi:hypothetical protein
LGVTGWLWGARRSNAPGLPDEIYFSVIQRKLLTPDDTDDLATLAERIQAFKHRDNQAAEPFDWRFNTDDLHRLLQRLKA